MRGSVLVLVSLVCLLHAVGVQAQAQVRCDEAGAHLSDCSAMYCPLTSNPTACQSGVVETSATIFDTEVQPCRTDLANAALMTSCANLTGASVYQQNICVEALEQVLACLGMYCPSAGADHETCERILPALREARDMADVECAAADRAQSEQLLEMSCDELLRFFGI